jgi:hypothetical protein
MARQKKFADLKDEAAKLGIPMYEVNQENEKYIYWSSGIEGGEQIFETIKKNIDQHYQYHYTDEIRRRIYCSEDQLFTLQVFASRKMKFYSIKLVGTGQR